MSSFAVWIDSEHAKIFKFTAEGVEPHSMNRSQPDHHTHAHKEDHNSDHFFHQIADFLAPATELIVLGPGLAKSHFKSHLDKHHHKALAEKVLAVETMDHATDPQILAAARKYFRAAHLFK